MLADTNQNAVSECESRPFFDIGHSLFNGIYLLVFVICYAGRYKTKKQYLNVNVNYALLLGIRYLTFAVKLVTYWIFESLNIQNLIFRYCRNLHLCHTKSKYSIYLRVSAICNADRYKTQYLNVNIDCFFLYWTFAI